MDEELHQDVHEVASGSPDMRTDLARRLHDLAPEAITDGKIDIAKLRELLSEDAGDDSERFGLFWPGKKRAMRAAQQPTTATLKPAKADSSTWDTTQNLFLEGDNLEILKILQRHYHGKVKLIYIDPPYNTGKDFVYPDNYTEGLRSYLEFTGQVDASGKKVSTNSDTEGRYHSNWLNMMYPRLKLARNLLREDGAIFISIDDNEVNNLRKECDEIFGVDNFIAQITVIVKTEGRRYGNLAKTHEYMLVYAKHIYDGLLNELEKDDGGFDYQDAAGGYNLTDLRNQNTVAFNSSNRPNLRYPFYVTGKQDANGHYEVSVEPSDGSIEVYPKTIGDLDSVWRWGKPKSAEESATNLIARKGSDGMYRVFQKYRSSTSMAKTVWFDKDIISNKGTKEVQALFGGKTYFDYPKPVALIEKCLRLGTSPDGDDIVLDLFAGSGTTAQAVMQLNAQDGGNRRYILVQLPEPTETTSDAHKAGYKTITTIARERINRAGASIMRDFADQLSQRSTPLDAGYRTYRLTDTNFSKWQTDYTGDVDVMQQRLVAMRGSVDSADEEATLTEIILKLGLPLTARTMQATALGLPIWSVADGSLVVCLDKRQRPTLEQFHAVTAKEPAKLVILDDVFQGDDELKTNLIQICKTIGIEVWTV